MKFAALILAAGLSSRMGRFKPTMKILGQTMLSWCASSLRTGGIDNILVVTGHNATLAQQEAHDLGLRCVYNINYSDGMFSSVKAGLREIDSCDGIFIQPVDMPLLRPATVTIMQEAFTGREVIYPVFDGERGHPPLIPENMREKLMKFKGKGGLRGSLRDKKIKEISVWDDGIMLDADKENEFLELCHRADRRDIPTKKEARALSKIYMKKRGQQHGELVAQVALALARGLKNHDAELDLELIFGAALLHDVAKRFRHHDKTGERFLNTFGLQRVAAIVGAHRDLTPPADGILREKELVFLADKMVRGNNKVAIKEYFDYKLASCHGKETERTLRRQNNAINIARLWEKSSHKEIEPWLKKTL